MSRVDQLIEKYSIPNFTNRIKSKYYKEGFVQLMFPISENSLTLSKDGILFYCYNGIIQENNYTNHPKRFLFPYSNLPIHEDELGVFINQLLKLDQIYLSIYLEQGKYKFITRRVYQENKKIYLESVTPLTKKEEIYSTKSKWKEELNKQLIEGNLICLLNENGKIINSDEEFSLSGLAISEKDGKLSASIYNLKSLEDNQVLIEKEKLLLEKQKGQDNPYLGYNVEPPITGKRK